MKTIALVDPVAGGHHPSTLLTFLEVLSESGCRVLLFAPQAPDRAVLAGSGLAGSESSVRYFPLAEAEGPSIIRGRVRRSISTLKRWLMARAALRKAERLTGWRIDLVFFAWLDSYLHDPSALVRFLTERLFRRHWTGLYFHPTEFRLPPPQARLWSRGRHRFARSSGCLGVAVLDEGVAEAMAAELDGKPVIVFPDGPGFTEVRDPSPELEMIRAGAGGRRIVGLLGSLERRKGVLSFLEVAQRRENEDLYFVLAGELQEHTFSPKEIAGLHTAADSHRQTNVFIRFGRIADEAVFNGLIRACDVLFAAYEEFPHSSNQLAKAAHFRKPVVVSRGFCMGERVESFRLGMAIEAGNVDEASAAIRTLAGQGMPDPGFDHYLRVHSRANLHLAFQTLFSSSPG